MIRRWWKLGLLAVLLLLGVAITTFLLTGHRETVYQGKPVSQWVLQLHSPYPEARLQAQQAIQKLGPGIVPELRVLLNRPEIALRRGFWKNVSRFPQPLRGWIAGALGPVKTTLVIPATCEALVVLGPDAAAAAPDLTRLLPHSQPEIAIAAARALGHIGPEGPRLLAPGLQSTNAEIRRLTAYSLGEAGPVALPWIDSLVERFADTDPRVRETAIAAVPRLGRECWPTLSRALGHSELRVRRGAAAAIARATPPYIFAFDPLARSARDPDVELRSLSIQAMGTLSGFNTNVLEALTGALSDPAPEVQLSALEALRSRGNYAAAATDAVAVLLTSPNETIRIAAIRTLGCIAPADSKVIATLQDLARQGPPGEQSAAIEALKIIAARHPK